MDFISTQDLYKILLFNLLFIGVGFATMWSLFSPKRLRKKGYSEEYINITHKQAIIGIRVFLSIFIAAQIIETVILVLMGYSITTELYFRYISSVATFIGWIAIAVYLFFFNKKYEKELKELAIETDSEVVIDFKFRALKMIINWKLEIPASLILIYYTFMYFNHRPILYLYALIPWIIFLKLYKMKYQVQATIRNSYKIISLTTILIQFCKGLIFVSFFMEEFKESLEPLSYFDVTLAVIFMIDVLAVIILGINNHPRIKRMFPDPSVSKTV
ncbi:hypothetical protein ACFL7D_02355 [candidate division KSB1 bacterium]